MAESKKTNDEAMEDLVQYLEKGYTEPRDWVVDLSVLFKALAMNHLHFVAIMEDNDVTFRSLIKLLKELSNDRHSNMFMATLTFILRQVFPSYAQDVKASELASVFSFEAKGAYTVRISEDTPTSAVNSLTLNGNGPVTVTVSVQKKDGATASVKDKGDGEAEG